MMKHNDDHKNNFLTSNKLVSKETSVANSSSRVYYGAAAGAVPFMWESQPGTPKHTLSETSLPPLTPPPSYSVNATPEHSSSSTMQRRSGSRAKALLDSIFPRALISMKAARNMSPSSSLSWSSSSSSSWSSSSSKGTQKRYYVSKMPFGYDDEEDEDEDLRTSGSPTSTVCFGIKRRGSDYFRGCNSMRKIKSAFLSIASQDQSRRGRTA